MRAHTPADPQDVLQEVCVCVCVFVSLMQFKTIIKKKKKIYIYQFTSGALSHKQTLISALPAASELLRLPTQSRFIYIYILFFTFCFRNKRSSLNPHTAGVLHKRDTSREFNKSYLRIIILQNRWEGRGLLITIATINIIFIFNISSCLWCCRVKISCRIFFFFFGFSQFPL